MNKNKSIFQTLFEINLNNHIEQKKELNYLSWPYAWAEVKKRFPDATYKIHLFGEKQLPYVFDENVGYMVFTSVTINDLTHTMWLPVMDSANKSMKSKSYTYSTKYKKDIIVEAATMFDINKTIMRCLVKNLAMFGLGLYIYSGEDLPETEENEDKISLLKVIKNSAKAKNKNADEIKASLEKKYNKTIDKLNSSEIKQVTEKLVEWSNKC